MNNFDKSKALDLVLAILMFAAAFALVVFRGYI